MEIQLLTPGIVHIHTDQIVFGDAVFSNTVPFINSNRLKKNMPNPSNWVPETMFVVIWTSCWLRSDNINFLVLQ